MDLNIEPIESFDEQVEKKYNSDDKMSDIIEKLYEEAKNLVDVEEGDRDNIMYLPKIIQPLKRLCLK